MRFECVLNLRCSILLIHFISEENKVGENFSSKKKMIFVDVETFSQK